MLLFLVAVASCKDKCEEDISAKFHRYERTILLNESFTDTLNGWKLDVYSHPAFSCDTTEHCQAFIQDGLFLKTGGFECPDCLSSATWEIPAGDYKYLAAEVKFKDFILNYDGVYSDFEQGFFTMRYADVSFIFGKKDYTWDDYLVLDLSARTMHFLMDIENKTTWAFLAPETEGLFSENEDFTSRLQAAEGSTNTVQFSSEDGWTDLGMSLPSSMSIEHVIIYEPVLPCD